MKVLEYTTAISFKNILLLTDLTPASQAAFSYAVALARHFDARLYPAHVVVPFLSPELEAPRTPTLLEELVTEKRHELVERVRNTGTSYTALVSQDAIEQVVPKWINEHGIDLIVMGTHGRKGMDRFLPAHVVAARQFGITLSVNFDYDGLPRHFCRRARHLGRSHPARATPCCPEIRQHRNFCILQHFIELLTINFQRFAYRRQRGFTVATPAVIGQMFCRNPVLLSALFAASNERHLALLIPVYNLGWHSLQAQQRSAIFFHLS
jgi:nucleotide-binding universal stress UspA family protein